MIKLPQKRIWKQINESDTFGDIWGSYNLNLTQDLGKIRTTRTLSVANSTAIAGMGIPVAFQYFNGQHFALTGTDTGSTILKTGLSRVAGWGLDSASGKPENVTNRYSDMVVFNDTLRVTGVNNTHYKWDGSSWSNFTWTNAQSGRPKMLCAYGDRIYQTVDYAKIESANTSDAIATVGNSYAINLGNPTVNTITCMRATSGRIYILTINRQGGKGFVYGWDGNQQSPNEIYRLESSGALAGIVLNDTLYIIDADGRLMYLNGIGGTFIEVDRFPFKQGKYPFFPLGSYNERWIHPNGMTVQDNRILILIKNVYRGATETYEENIPSGVWEWSEQTGLYHKYSLSYREAIDGTTTDYGQSQVSVVGAISSIKSESLSATDNGSLLIGAQLYTNASSTENHILIDDLNNTVEKTGYFITPKFFSDNITDIFQKAILRFQKISGTDEIVVKYRTEDEEPLYIDVTTWSNSGAVRTTSTVTDYNTGDEIEFLRGKGAGMCFKILSKADLGGGVTEITLDGKFVGINGTGKARLQHWKQIPAFTGSKDYNEFHIPEGKSTWIQFKVFTKFTGNKYLYDMTIANKTNQSIQ